MGHMVSREYTPEAAHLVRGWTWTRWTVRSASYNASKSGIVFSSLAVSFIQESRGEDVRGRAEGRSPREQQLKRICE